MKSGVYEFINTKTGMRYIGGTENLGRREIAHFSMLRGGTHKNAPLQAAWDLHGEKSFEFVVILRCLSNDLNKYEQACIDSYDFESLYNKCPMAGSSQGSVRSDAVRANMSAAQMRNRSGLGNQNSLGHAVSDEARTKISAAHMGRIVSEKTRARISATKQARRKKKGDER